MESDRWARDSTETSERCAGLNFSGWDLTYRTVVWQIFPDFLTGSVHALWLLEYWAQRSLLPSLWLLDRKEIVVCKEFPAAILNFGEASPSLVPDTCPPVSISVLILLFFFFLPPYQSLHLCGWELSLCSTQPSRCYCRNTQRPLWGFSVQLQEKEGRGNAAVPWQYQDDKCVRYEKQQNT